MDSIHLPLSIIIPVYNVEKYIRECIQSCAVQDFPSEDYEIIVVNDGTQDNSMAIVEELSNLYKNIIIYNQENQGLSVARNTGLSKAKGEYVWFVDSDDSIVENSLKGIVESLKSAPDVLQIQYQLVYEDGRPNKSVEFTNIEGIKTGEEVLLAGGLPTPVQFSIYRRGFLISNNLCFYPGIYHEDVEFKPRAVYSAERIMSHNAVVYNYLQRATGSITSNYKLKNGLDSIIVCQSLYSFSKNLSSPIRSAFSERITQVVNSNMNRLKHLNNHDKELLLSEWARNKNLFRYMMLSKSLLSKIEGGVFFINVRIGAFLFRIFFKDEKPCMG